MLIHRLFNHLGGLFRLFSHWPSLTRHGRQFFGCITVDVDAHGHPQAFEKGIPFLLRLYERMGLRGKVTWFINPLENILDQNVQLLRRIIHHDYEIGMHSHLEDLCRPDDQDTVFTRLGSDKERLEAFAGQKVLGFRSGRFFRTPAIMNVLPKLHFLYDSSFTYGRVFQIGDYTMDDSGVSRQDSVFPLVNGMVEFPVWEPYPNPAEIGPSHRPYFITTMVHPYNMVTAGRSNLIVQVYYRYMLTLLSRIPNIQFIPLKKAFRITLDL